MRLYINHDDLCSKKNFEIFNEGVNMMRLEFLK